MIREGESIRSFCNRKIEELLEKGERRMVSGKYNREKGANFERELVQIFKKVFPGEDIKRGLQYRSGVEAPDVECPLLWVEAKRMKRPNIKAAYKQALDACPEGRIAVAITKANREQAMATVSLEDFTEIMSVYWRAVCE